MKRVISVLLLLVSILAISSCSGNVDWSDDNGYKDATLLDSSYVENGKELVLNISNPSNYLSNITKDKIIVKAKNSTIDSSSEELTQEELKKNAITDYELEINDNIIKIMLKSYEEDIYLVVFNKSITNDKKYAYSFVSLIEDTFDDQPFVDTDETITYIEGDKNPILSFSFDNLEIIDINKIKLDEGFKNLSLISATKTNNNVNITTQGRIEYGYTEGNVILEIGFFKDIDYDIELVYEINFVGYVIDNSSFKVENNTFSFDVLLSKKLNGQIKKEAISLGDNVNISKSKIINNGYGIRINTPVNEDLENTLISLDKTDLFIDFALDGYNEFEDLYALFDVNYPTYKLYADMEDKKINLHFRYLDAIVSDIKEDMIEIDSDDISLVGDDKNAKISSISATTNGFDIVIETDSRFDSVKGVLDITNSDSFKTLWGAPYSGPVLEFECSQENKIVLTSEDPNKEKTGKYDEEFTEEVITNKPTVDLAANIIMFAAYATQFGVSLYTENYGEAIGSIINAAQFYGLNGHSSEPTIQNVLDKLDDMTYILNSIDKKIDELKQQMTNDMTAVELSINKVLFNQYRSTWDTFHENYIEKIDDLLRSYITDMRTYYVNFARKTEDFTIKLKYFKKDNGNIVLSIENPNDLGYSIEGYKFDSEKEVNIKVSYFEKSLELLRLKRGYSDTFDMQFRNDLYEMLRAGYPSLNADELHKLINDVYAHITGLAQMSAVNDNLAKELSNLFINFAKQISGKATGTSKMTYYYKMLESLYNFQSEAATEIKSFRGNMKLLLDKYANFTTSIIQFCPGIDAKEIATVYMDAYNYINNYKNMVTVNANEDYCYTVNSKITTSLVKCAFNPRFTQTGNKAKFAYSYKVTNVLNGSEIKVVNNSQLLSNSNLKSIFNRYINSLRMAGKQTSNTTLHDYLKARGLITKAIAEKTKISDTIAITSFTGIYDLSSSGFNLVCVDKGHGKYFKVGNVYSYKGSKEKKCWSGKEASGTLFSLIGNRDLADHINRMARYDESHWYWPNDEHWAFEEWNGGRIALAIYRV